MFFLQLITLQMFVIYVLTCVPAISDKVERRKISQFTRTFGGENVNNHVKETSSLSKNNLKKDLKTNLKKTDLKTDFKKELKTNPKKDLKTESKKKLETNSTTDLTTNSKKDLETNSTTDLTTNLTKNIKTITYSSTSRPIITSTFRPISISPPFTDAPVILEISTSVAPTTTDRTMLNSKCKNCKIEDIGRIIRNIPSGIEESIPIITLIDNEEHDICLSAKVVCEAQNHKTTIMEVADRPSLRTETIEEDSFLIVVCTDNQWKSYDGIGIANVNCYHLDTFID